MDDGQLRHHGADVDSISNILVLLPHLSQFAHFC